MQRRTLLQTGLALGSLSAISGCATLTSQAPAKAQVVVIGGGYGGAGAGAERSSGASGWEDRSYGVGGDSFGEGRSRRRRSSQAGPQSGNDDYGGAEV